MMRALLLSTYEMGRQPFGLASPAAWLRAAGWSVDCVDLAKERLRDETVQHADLIGFYLPMHTATRLAEPVILKTRALNRSARLCAFGLYAPLTGKWLRSLGIDEVLGGEFEEGPTALALGWRAVRGCASCSSPSCWPTLRARWPPAPATSPSAILISSTVRRTRPAWSTDSTPRIPT